MFLALFSVSAFATPTPTTADHFLWGDGQTVVFLGDSITAQTKDRGFVDTARALVAALYPDRRLNFVNAGEGGDRVQDMMDRAPSVFRGSRTDWIVLFGGMNDVDADASGQLAGQFRTRYRALAQACKDAAHGNVLLMTVAVEEPLTKREDKAVRLYSEVVRQTAKELNLRVANVDGAMFTAIRRGVSLDPNYALTIDGVHMNQTGAALIAATMLNAVGFSAGAVPDVGDWHSLELAERVQAKAAQRGAVDQLLASLSKLTRRAMDDGTALNLSALNDQQRLLVDRYVNPMGYGSIVADYRDTRAATGTIRIYHKNRRRHVAVALQGQDWTFTSDEGM